MPDPIEAQAEAMPGENTTSREIVERVGAGVTEHTLQVMPVMGDDEIRRTWRIASALARSRMFKDAVQAEQAFAKILIGRDLGIAPTQALMSIDLVKGSIQLRGVLLGSFVRKHPNYDYKVVESDHTHAKILFRRRWEGEWEDLGESEFTIQDAERARLVKTDGGWASHPKNMCIWRALSNGVKFHCPDLLGGMPVYVEGELDGSAPSYGAVPTSAQSTQTTDVDLPEEIAQLVARAHAIDPTTWRPTEVAARLPETNGEGYSAAVESLVVELKQWLDEHDPPEAEVVESEAEVVDGEPVGDGNEHVDVAVALQQRWASDEAWQTKVGSLLNQRADMEGALDAAVAEGDEEVAETLRTELGEIEGALDSFGVPVGWFPEGVGASA